jgi:hypothetical protein
MIVMPRLNSRALLLALALAPTFASAAPTQPGELTNPLVESELCGNCHGFVNAMADPPEPYYSPVFGWTASLMGNAARDPVFWAGVAIASQDHSDETIECVRCHAPRAFLEGRGDAIAQDELMPQDLVGVECEVCHRMTDDGVTPAGNAQYVIDDVLVDGVVPRRGPWTYDIGDPSQPPHPWINEPYSGTARLCGTCHDVTTPRERVDDDGNGMGMQFNEQRTYSEWLGSAFADPQDPEFRSCQDCHMPAMPDIPGCFDNLNVSSHPTGGRRHDLVGANRFMVEVMKTLYGGAGTGEVPDILWDHTLGLMDDMLATAATLEVTGPQSVDLTAGLADLAVRVTNQTGHKLPTGYSEGRVMWIEVVARYGDEVVWSSGAWDQAAGTIEADAQLRTYRAVAEQWSSGTQLHLLLNDHWVEDTRIPPLGLEANVETDPIGRYSPRMDGTWPNYDDVTYAFAAAPQIADATPEATDDDVLTVDVRVLYLINTPEYIEFLSSANRTNAAGDDIAMVFDELGGATPVVLAEEQLAIPITAFGSAVDSSGSAGTTTSATDGTSLTGEVSSSGDGTGSTTGENDEGGGNCNCDAGAPRTRGWWIVPLAFALRSRRRRAQS